MIRTGIFGGSFNPIHTGHLALAKAVLEQCRLDEVWLMVSPQNPLKQGSTDLLDDRLRLLMARAALHGEESVRASDYEMHLPKPSYTWNTLQKLKTDYADCQFVLLMGGDNWLLFHRWYRAEDILREFHIVVYPRSKGEFDACLPLEPHQEKAMESDSVVIVDAELLPVSSTMIRQRVRNGESIAGLVPKSIETLIKYCYR